MTVTMPEIRPFSAKDFHLQQIEGKVDQAIKDIQTISRMLEDLVELFDQKRAAHQHSTVQHTLR